MSDNQDQAIEGEIVTTDLGALAVMTKAEIDANVATAKQYPRSLTTFRKEAAELVTLTAKISEDCIFALPRGKENGKQKFIEGPSVRFSEMIVSAYGNCRSGARIIGEEKDFVIAEGFFHDLEKNVAVKVEVKRRIVDSRGKRYNSDMIAVTGNAACSIARRNAALQAIPKAIWSGLYEAAKKTAVGDNQTMVAKRTELLAYFQKLNVTPETIFEYMDVKGADDLGVEELTILRGIANAIKEGATTVEKAFSPEDVERNSGAKKIFDHLGANGKDKTPVPDPEPATEKKKETASAKCDICFEDLPNHHFTCSKSTEPPGGR